MLLLLLLLLQTLADGDGDQDVALNYSSSTTTAMLPSMTAVNLPFLSPPSQWSDSSVPWAFIFGNAVTSCPFPA
ncbi:hypothetical protein STEG23_018979 [Scotinomys teguina]